MPVSGSSGSHTPNTLPKLVVNIKKDIRRLESALKDVAFSICSLALAILACSFNSPRPYLPLLLGITALAISIPLMVKNIASLGSSRKVGKLVNECMQDAHEHNQRRNEEYLNRDRSAEDSIAYEAGLRVVGC